MVFEVVRSRASDRDFDLLFDHLVEVHQALGDPPGEAFERAAARVRAVETDMERLGRVPHQGTLREDLRPGLRQATRNRAVFHFEIDEAREEVRVLAVFFGGRDRPAPRRGSESDGERGLLSSLRKSLQRRIWMTERCRQMRVLDEEAVRDHPGRGRMGQT